MREKGTERDGDREPAEDSIYLACSERDRVKATKPPERTSGTSVRKTWMMSTYGGRGSLMTVGTAVLCYP